MLPTPRVRRPLLAAAPLALVAALSASLAPGEARAFCGFYVGGADAKLFNNATEVVLMREGTRTVLSMQNNYQGPPEDFAMVVPVPVVLQKDNVKTLKRDLFDLVDRLSAPRLVEYWEQDPCPVTSPFRGLPAGAKAAPSPKLEMSIDEKKAMPSVRIEAQFTVGEYEIVILSADDALALDAWLRQNGYKIPEGAEPILRPYVQGGMKFFVAKVDPKKVAFKNGMAELSPLRFHYDSELFSLPVRLGLLNSKGTQDLIVNILAKGQRYEVANYPNVAIPTNLDVLAKVKPGFAGFYASLFDTAAKKHPGAVVTEYAWDAGSCDPCPGPPLGPGDLTTLGADVLGPGPGAQPPPSPRRGRFGGGGWVLTRLHARYAKEGLGEDLVFKEAPPIMGGREAYQDNGQLETTARQAQINNFQARYAIRHLWNGPITCAHPQRGIWGGPPGGEESLVPATGLAFAPRNVAVAGNVTRGSIDAFVLSGASKVASTIPVGIPMATAQPAVAPSAEPQPPAIVPAPSASAPPPAGPPPPPPPPSTAPAKGGCAGCLVGAQPGDGSGLAALASLVGVLALAVRGRRRR